MTARKSKIKNVCIYKVKKVKKETEKNHKSILTIFHTQHNRQWVDEDVCGEKGKRCFVSYLWRKLRIIMKNYALSSIT